MIAPSPRTKILNWNKVWVFDLVQVFNYDISLHFYNQSEIYSEDNTKWGRLNKIKDTDFKDLGHQNSFQRLTTEN